MKKKVYIIACVLIALVLSGCGGDENGAPASNEAQLTEPTPEPTKSPEAIAVEAYEAAINEYESSEAYKITLEVNTTRKRGEESIKELLEETINFENVQSEDFRAYVTDKISLQGDLEVIECAYLYDDGKIYSSEGYYTETDASGFIAELYPTALITPELYNTIVYDETIEKLSFSEPSQAESWLDIGEGTLISAYAEVSLEENKIIHSFEAEYIVGDVSIAFTLVSCVSEADKTLDISQKLDSIDKNGVCVNDMRAYEYWARGDGFNYSPAQTCIATDDIIISVADLHYIETAEQNCYGTGSNLVFHIPCKYNISIQGSEMESEGEVSYYMGTLRQKISGKDALLVETDAETVNRGINLSEYMIGFADVTAVEVTEDAECYILDFESNNEGYADIGYLIQYNICNKIFSDGFILEDQWLSYETISICGTMKLDKVTLLPLEYTLEYAGSYVIGGESHTISLVNKIEMDMFSETAYNALLQAGYAMKRNSSLE